MKKAQYIIILARPLNCLITFLSIWVGAVVAGRSLITLRIFDAALAGAFIAAYGNTVNDIFDIEIDKMNKPYRPLARGDVSRSDAISAALYFAIAGLGLSIFVHIYAALITLFAIGALYAYTPIFKGKPYLGNILIACISSISFIVGGLAVDNPFGAMILVVFAFLLHFAREIVKDIQDRAADSAHDINTAAVSDVIIARKVAIAILLILILATLAPYCSKQYGLVYLLIVLFGADFLVALSIAILFKTSSASKMRLASAYLKAAMPLGLLAILIGQL